MKNIFFEAKFIDINYTLKLFA